MNIKSAVNAKIGLCLFQACNGAAAIRPLSSVVCSRLGKSEVSNVGSL